MTDIRTDEKVDEVVLPDPRPSDPLEALSWLGETEEEVVQGLRERGIKGHRKYADACPLTNYLMNWWEYVSVFVSVCVTDDETEFYYVKDTPPHCYQFAVHFDSGAHPDLIAD